MTRNGWVRLWLVSGMALLSVVSGSVKALELEGELLRQERLGYYYWGRGDVFGGMQYLRPVAEAGHALSQYRMGLMEYAASNFEAAAEWQRRALNGGVHEAGLELARMYRTGELGEKDLKAAFELEYAAAQEGLVDAMLRVASAYRSGSGVEVSAVEEHNWYRRAADQGDLQALQWLLSKQRSLASSASVSQNQQAIAELEDEIKAAKSDAERRRIELRKSAFEEFRSIEKEYLGARP